MDINNSYYECKRCFHRTYQKIHMAKHLDKKNLCLRTFESFKYKDDELYDLSLERIKNNNKFICINCNKNFGNNNTLKIHIEKSCKNKKIYSENLNVSPIEASEIVDSKSTSIHIDNNDNNDISNSNNINSTINSTINSNNININNININITKSFDEQWKNTSRLKYYNIL